MPNDFDPAFAALKAVLAKRAKRLAVAADQTGLYALVTKSPSPFPQHKGRPLDFGSVRTGKAYVSFHLMPVYMSPALAKLITPALKKRMQGKSCFNFKAAPEKELLDDLSRLIEAALKEWDVRAWL